MRKTISKIALIIAIISTIGNAFFVITKQHELHQDASIMTAIALALHTSTQLDRKE